MSKSNDFLRGISTLIEAGLISSKEFKKELNTSFKFRKDDLILKYMNPVLKYIMFENMSFI